MKLRNIQELIDRFNAGEMVGPERDEFIRLIESDPTIAEDVKLSKKIDDFFSNNMERVELREQLDSIYNKLNKEGKLSTEGDAQNTNPSISHVKWYHVAASIIILLGISLVLCLMLRPPKNERLYAQYFIPYDGDYATRSVEEHPKPKDKYHLALDQYNDGHYEQSWKMFKELSGVDSIKIEVLFYRGNSAMEINKYDDAINSFKYI
ncbi:MAG: hypothetical protein ABR968_03615 [Bacteroidales bacterium]|jgi:hypothetical protein